jgi:hypothetical protein
MFVSSTASTLLKRCGRCACSKPVSEFAWRRRSRDQRDNYCRACRAAYKQAHYAANRARYISDARRRKQRIATERAAYLIEFFRTRPCVDCAENDPLVLEFDHLVDKSFAIAKGCATTAGKPY